MFERKGGEKKEFTHTLKKKEEERIEREVDKDIGTIPSKELRKWMRGEK